MISAEQVLNSKEYTFFIGLGNDFDDKSINKYCDMAYDKLVSIDSEDVESQLIAELKFCYLLVEKDELLGLRLRNFIETIKQSKKYSGYNLISQRLLDLHSISESLRKVYTTNIALYHVFVDLYLSCIYKSSTLRDYLVWVINTKIIENIDLKDAESLVGRKDVDISDIIALSSAKIKCSVCGEKVLASKFKICASCCKKCAKEKQSNKIRLRGKKVKETDKLKKRIATQVAGYKISNDGNKAVNYSSDVGYVSNVNEAKVSKTDDKEVKTNEVKSSTFINIQNLIKTMNYEVDEVLSNYDKLSSKDEKLLAKEIVLQLVNRVSSLED